MAGDKLYGFSEAQKKSLMRFLAESQVEGSEVNEQLEKRIAELEDKLAAKEAAEAKASKEAKPKAPEVSKTSDEKDGK